MRIDQITISDSMQILSSIDSPRYLESVQMLENVADFLSRMPKHPMTHDMLMRVHRFLDAPGALVENMRIANSEALRTVAQEAISGALHTGSTLFSSSGVPLVSCALRGNRLELSSPGLNESGLSDADVVERQNQVLHALKRVVEIDLNRPWP